MFRSLLIFLALAAASLPAQDVPFSLSLPLFIGGLARHFIDGAKQTEKWRLAAGGVIAGEGLIGAIIVLLAAAKFFGL